MRNRKFLRKLFMFLLTIPVLLFIYFPILWLFSASLSNQVELFASTPTLDPAASHPPKLSGHYFPQFGCLFCPAHLYGFFAQLFQDCFRGDDHLPRDWQPGSLCAGAHPVQIQSASF